MTTRNDNQEYSRLHSLTTDVNNKGTNDTHAFEDSRAKTGGNFISEVLVLSKHCFISRAIADSDTLKTSIICQMKYDLVSN